MKQKLFILNEHNLDEINKLLEDGYTMGNQYHTNGGASVYVILMKYTPAANNGMVQINPYPYNGGY